MTYYAAQPMPMMPGMSGVLAEVLKAPISRWNQSSTIHKVLAAGAGAGLAYFLHQKGMADPAVAVAGIAGAYATSMALHYPTMAQQPAALQPPQPAAAITGGLPAAATAAQEQPVSGMMAAPAAPSAPPPAPGSKWALLG